MPLWDLAIEVTPVVGSMPPTAQPKGEQLFHTVCVRILTAGVIEEEPGKDWSSGNRVTFNSTRCTASHILWKFLLASIH